MYRYTGFGGPPWSSEDVKFNRVPKCKYILVDREGQNGSMAAPVAARSQQLLLQNFCDACNSSSSTWLSRSGSKSSSRPILNHP